MTKKQAYYRLAMLMLGCGNMTSAQDMVIKAGALGREEAAMVLSEDGTAWVAA